MSNLVAGLMAVLSTMAAKKRGGGIALDDGGSRDLALSPRRFGNLSEYAAMAILMLLLIELAGVAPIWLNTYGIALAAVLLPHPLILFDTMEASGAMKFGHFVAGAGTAALLLACGVVLLVIGLR